MTLWEGGIHSLNLFIEDLAIWPAVPASLRETEFGYIEREGNIESTNLN